MNYYSVLVLSKTKTSSLFTYASETKLTPGRVVLVPFRTSEFYGIVVENATAYPKSKSIIELFDTYVPVSLLSASLQLMQHSGLSGSGVAQLLLSSLNPRRVAPELEPKQLAKPPMLTDLQQDAVNQINSAKQGAPTMLFGITGSGKTRVYIELISQQLQAGKSCVVLSPEVGLGSQLAADIALYFGDKVIFSHSNQTKKEREIAWIASNASSPKVIVGPRSSLFLPTPNLGLIVLDEFHDDSYKQSSEPRYHALNAASLIAKQSGCICVCGSATPNVTDYHLFQKAGYPIIELTKKAKEATPAEVIFVDTKTNPSKTLISKVAENHIKDCINNGRQALVFFNRRGTSRLVSCEECGYIELCPKCDYQLTLHRDRAVLICHSCDYRKKPSSSCLECKSPLSYQSPGIQQLEQEIRKKFPESAVIRFDSDTNKEDSLHNQLQNLKTKLNTIIIGTQVVTKGLDLPLLGTVIVVRAESALAIPDYRAEERLYQQISQLIGRVGRGHIEKTSVVLQVHGKSSHTLRLAAAEDWQAFYDQEIKARKAAGLPPFRYIASIKVRRKTEKGVESASEKLANKLTVALPHIQLIGPAPALIEKKPAYYEWTIQALSARRSELLKIDAFLGSNDFLDLDPTQIF